MVDWRDQAACRTVDPDVAGRLFYPGGYGEDYASDIAASKVMCAQCPVWESCLEQGFDREDWGTWGGLTEWERIQFRGRWNRGELSLADIALHGTEDVAETCTLGKAGKRCIACAAWWRLHKKDYISKRCTFCGMSFLASRDDRRFCTSDHARRYRRGRRQTRQEEAS